MMARLATLLGLGIAVTVAAPTSGWSEETPDQTETETPPVHHHADVHPGVPHL